MAFPDRCWVNGKSLAAFKMLVGDPKGFTAVPSRSDSLVPLQGRMGSLWVSGESETAPRRVTVEAALVADSAAERATLWDAFTKWASAEELELRFVRWPDRVGVGRYQGIDSSDLPGIVRGERFTMTFLMADPLKYALEPDLYMVLNGTESAIGVGTAASDLWLRLIGVGASNPTVYYKDAQGRIAGDVTFAVTLGLYDWIDFNWDGYQQGILHVHARDGSQIEAVTNIAPTSLAPTGGHFPIADPLDADAGGTSPVIEAVGCDVWVALTKAYL